MGSNQVLSTVYILSALCLGPSVLAIEVGFGSCPDQQVVTNFDVTRYTGLWYEVEKFSQIFERNGKCSKAEYSLGSNGEVAVKNSMIDISSGEEISIEGTAVLTSGTDAKLKVTFTFPIIGGVSAPLWVLDTDYSRFALAYSCRSILGLFKLESAWLLSRTPQLESAVEQRVQDVKQRAGLKSTAFLKTVQDCN